MYLVIIILTLGIPNENEMTELNQKILEVALSEYGIKEIEGDIHNSRILQYFREIGFQDIQNDETGWGAAFANWVLSQVGQKHSSKLTARSLLTIGDEATSPLAGDLCVFWRSSPTSWKGNVGFYINEDSESIYVLGGNQNNQVQISAYPRERLLGIRRITSFTEEETCKCEDEETNDDFLNDFNEAIPEIPIRLIFLGVRRNQSFAEKILGTVSSQLKLRFVIESTQKVPEKYSIDWLYNEPNLDTAANLAETKGLNQKGITLFIGDSGNRLNGFAFRSSNSAFIDYDSQNKYSSTIAHEIGHVFGLNHTFEMTDEVKEKLGIIGDSEKFNLMNYNVYTDHLTPQQINIVHNSAASKFAVIA